MSVRSHKVLIATIVVACFSFSIPCSKADVAPTPLIVNEAAANGDTPLMQASSFGDLARLNALIAAGADVNAKSKVGNTALLLAPNATFVKALIKAGANVNEAAPNGDTPLMQASSFGDLARLNELIAAGADVNAKSKAGDTALLLAPNAKIIGSLIEAKTGGASTPTQL